MSHAPEPHGSGGKAPTHLQVKRKFLAAEREQESGGNYLVVNQTSGALGAWQVMPANLPGWLRESGQADISDYAYLHSVKAQNRLAWVVLGGAFDKYGAAGAAAWWYCGKPTPGATYGDPPVYKYVEDVLALMGEKLPPVDTTGLPSSPYAYTLPPPNQDDWSAQVRAAAKSHHDAAAGLSRYAAAIDKLR